MPPIPWVYCEIVRRLARVERVHILVNDEAAERNAGKLLKAAHADGPAVDFFHSRRIGVGRAIIARFLFATSGTEPVITDWRFNGWAKYDNWQTDDAVPSAIASKLGMKSIQPKLGRRRVVLEGGSIDVNGAGSLLTTEECLLSDVQQRNPGFTREDYESIFAHYLGIRRDLWLHRGIAGDDTHGHVDDLARFVDESTVVIAAEQDKSEENYEPLRENLRLLKTMTDQDGDFAWFRFRCLSRYISPASGCRRVTRIFTLQTGLCSCRRLTIRTIA